MGIRAILLLTILLFLCFVDISTADAQMGGVAQLIVRGGNRRLFSKIDCNGLCEQRCSLHSRPNVCTRACGTCCSRCNCVPPGTSGNREACGRCYTDMLTHGNKPKCP